MLLKCCWFNVERQGFRMRRRLSSPPWHLFTHNTRTSRIFQASEAALVGFTKLANKEVNALCLVDADGKVSRAGGPVRNACMRV